MQDKGIIDGFLRQYEAGDPWVPVHNEGPWFTTETFRALLALGRITVDVFYGHVFLGALDGVRVTYTKGLIGGRAELTV